MLCRSSINWQPNGRVPAIIAHPPAASLDEAHAAIELWEFYSRKSLDAEQRLAVELMMAESADGRWAADTTGRAESRQNGKGDEIEVVELWGLLQRSEAILHTAHEAATAASAHMRMVGLIEGHRDLRLRLKKKQSWNGNYSLILNNDGTIVWRTRTGAGGRGLDDISRIVIDEAQHAQPEELASSLPILSVNPNPQKNFIGSGGVRGKSAFWWRQRRRALAGDHGRFSWLEHSAQVVSLLPDGRVVTEMGDVADPEVWRRANPAYPSRISHDFLLDQLKTLGPELFAREHLCVWDPEPSDAASGDLDLARWAELHDVFAEPRRPLVLGVDQGEDRLVSIGVAWRRPDGRPQLMLDQADSVSVGLSPAEAVERLAVLRRRYKARVVLGGPAVGLERELRDAGVPIETASGAQFVTACGQFDDRMRARTVRHGNQPQLNAAVAVAKWRSVGTDGAQAFVLRDVVGIGPLAAAVRALHGLLSRGAGTQQPVSITAPTTTSALSTMTF